MFYKVVKCLGAAVDWTQRIYFLNEIIIGLVGIGIKLMNFVYSDILGLACFTIATILFIVKCCWVYKKRKHLVEVNILDSNFIPLGEAISIYTNSLSEYQNTENYINDIWQRPWGNNEEMVPKEVYSLLLYVHNGQMTLYGHKLLATNEVEIQPIKTEELPSDVDFFNKNLWSTDYKTIYDSSKNIIFTNLAVSKEEFDKLKYNP